METSIKPAKQQQFKKRSTTLRRHEIVRERFNSYYLKTYNGIKLDFDSVIVKVSEEMGYSERYVRDILNDRC